MAEICVIILALLAYLWIFLRDFHDINTVSYNGKEQIVSKAKSGTHVRVHVYMWSHVAWHCPCKHYSEQVQLHMAVQLKPNL